MNIETYADSNANPYNKSPLVMSESLAINDEPRTIEDFQEEFIRYLSLFFSPEISPLFWFDAPEGCTNGTFTYCPDYSQIEQIPDVVVAEIFEGNRRRNAWLIPSRMPHNNCLYVTFTDGNLDEQRRKLQNAPLEPTLIVRLGNNLHVMWLTDENIENCDWIMTQVAFAEYFQTDFSFYDFSVAVAGSDFIDKDGKRTRVKIEFWVDENVYTHQKLRQEFNVTEKDYNVVWKELEKKEIAKNSGKVGIENYGAKFLPKGVQVGQEGVLWQKDDAATSSFILTTPLWLKRVIQTADTREAHLEIEWISYGDKVESALMPASLLADKGKLTAFLYERNIAGFSATKQIEGVREYLRRSVLNYNEKHKTETAYNRFGWHGDDFIIGSDLITPKGIKPANLVRIPSETIDGLKAKGRSDKWAEMTARLTNKLMLRKKCLE